ncbi:hypothetical protein [Mycobacterium sp. URHB0044]|uniref:hypothetical protein n=1 Tax=Mycobacterium sp. URHB0044 TaxID=1380386 RepID=UPI0012DFD63F|nr:hypothetical protein [Mycobacterium sp. URHB0044]
MLMIEGTDEQQTGCSAQEKKAQLLDSSEGFAPTRLPLVVGLAFASCRELGLCSDY